METTHFLQKEQGFQSSHVSPIMAIGVGVLLWFEPTLLLPVLAQPIDRLLHSIGLLSSRSADFEGFFTAVLLLRWLAVALLLAFVLGVERLPLRSIGIRKSGWQDLLLSIGIALIAAFAALGLYLLANGPHFAAHTQTEQIRNTLSWLEKIHLIVNAATVEELFFRGFLIERVIAATRRPWLGGVVSFVLFVVSHLSGSGVILTLAGIALPSLVFVLLYLWRRNLFLCMVAHAIGDAMELFWP